MDQLKYPALPAFSLPRPTRTVLPNGLVVLVMEDHELPLVSVSARFRTGSLLEPANKIGVASLTGSQMRSGGTVALAPEALDRYLEGRAASIESSIGDDAGSAGMSVLKQDFGEVLQVFSDVLRQPRFDPARLEVARRGIEAGIARQNDDPNSIASREFRELMYGGDTPFARQVTYATVQGLTREDLVAWHAKYLHPDQTILAVHGDITAAEAWRRSQGVRLVGAGPEQAITFPEPRPQSAPGVFEAVKSDVAQSSIRIGHMGTLKSTHPDYYPVQVLNEVLSGSFTSRLFSSVRTAKGLAYSVGGGVGSNYTRVAPFSMSTSTKTATTAETIETLIAEAKRIIAEPPTAVEIDRAKQSILNSFIFNSGHHRTGARAAGDLRVLRPADRLARAIPRRHREGDAGRHRTRGQAVHQARAARDPRRRAHRGPRQAAEHVRGGEDARHLHSRAAVRGPCTRSVGHAWCRGRRPRPRQQGRRRHGRRGGRSTASRRTARRRPSATTPQGEMELQSTMLVAPPDRVRQEIVTPMGCDDDDRSPAPPARSRADRRVRAAARGAAHADAASRCSGRRSSCSSAAASRLQGESRPARARWARAAVTLVRVEVEGDTMTLGIDPATGQTAQPARARHRARPAPRPTCSPSTTDYPCRRDVRAASQTAIIGGSDVQKMTVKSMQVNPPLPADAFGAAK